MAKGLLLAVLVSCILLLSLFSSGCASKPDSSAPSLYPAPPESPILVPNDTQSKHKAPLKGSAFEYEGLSDEEWAKLQNLSPSEYEEWLAFQNLSPSELEAFRKRLEEIEKMLPEGGPQSAQQQPEKPAGEGSKSVDTSGNYAASLDFKVARDGFGFENYGNEKSYKNLEAGELVRLFGDGICANKVNTCTLTPPAKQWMQQVNDAMNGGHCEGMATLSLLFATGRANASSFGASTAYSLPIEGNEKLQREIAYWFTTQSTQPTSTSTIKMSPTEIADHLAESFKSGKEGEKYTLGIYKRDMNGGHAITPWAIEERPDGKTWIMVYDNNYPGADRAVVVDRQANTWRYTGSSNPAVAEDVYDGNATSMNLELTPTSSRMQKQTCPFCEESEQGAAAQQPAGTKGSLSQSYNQVWMDGKGDLLLTDSNGKRLGMANGKLVQEIPGAHYVMMKGAEQPTYEMPKGTAFTMTIDGTRLKATSPTDIVMIGPGYDLGLLNISLAPGRKDTAVFSPSGNSVSYTTTGTKSLEIIYGIETKDNDYEFSIIGSLESGGTINSALDTKKGKLSVSTKDNNRNITFRFSMVRIDDSSSYAFGNEEGIVLEPNDTMYFNYANWTGNKGSLVVEIDSGSTGTIDESVVLKDDE